MAEDPPSGPDYRCLVLKFCIGMVLCIGIHKRKTLILVFVYTQTKYQTFWVWYWYGIWYFKNFLKSPNFSKKLTICDVACCIRAHNYCRNPKIPSEKFCTKKLNQNKIFDITKMAGNLRHDEISLLFYRVFATSYQYTKHKLWSWVWYGICVRQKEWLWYCVCVYTN